MRFTWLSSSQTPVCGQRIEQRFVVVVDITAALIRREQNNMNFCQSLDGLGTARNCSIMPLWLLSELATSLANHMASLQPFAGSAPVTVYAWWKWVSFMKSLKGSPRHPERLPAWCHCRRSNDAL
jgi:hypothetical protein